MSISDKIRFWRRRERFFAVVGLILTVTLAMILEAR
jgi:hypothetical protein